MREPAAIFTEQFFFNITDLVAMSTNQFTLITQQGPGTIIVPVSPLVAAYQYRSRAFGGNPTLSFGFPDYLNMAVVDLALTGVDSTIFYVTTAPYMTGGDALLSVAQNQPLVMQLSSAILNNGPVLLSSLASGGTLWAVNDTFSLPGGVAGKVLTVSGGVVLTYQITNAGTTAVVGAAQAATNASANGIGLTINIDSVTAGDGTVYVEFDWKLVELPKQAGVTPTWPIQAERSPMGPGVIVKAP